MKRLNIFPKTFLYTLSLMLLVVLFSHLLIYFLMPHVYSLQQKQRLEQDIDSLTRQFADCPYEKRMEYVTAFAAKWKADISVRYEGFSYEMNTLGEYAAGAVGRDGTVEAVITTDKTDDSVRFSLVENPKGGTELFHAEQFFDGGKGSVKAVVSREQIEDAVSAILMILPFTAVLSAIISVFSALFYSRVFTKPIRQISAATERMRRLEPDASCMVRGQDEFGMLTDNVNDLYRTLLRTIRELEQEIKKVEEADTQKIAFLRTASHELKTPVTAVNVMLENMLLQIGRYKDRDTYLAKCKKMVERLSDMIKEILDASRPEGNGGETPEEIDVAEAVVMSMEPYLIIARAKGIRIETDLEDTLPVRLPKNMFEKVLSNLLSNAVSYTPRGGVIRVSTDADAGLLTIENECAVIPPEHLAHIFEAFYRPDYSRDRESGGNGLGLYIVASLLKALDIEYEFVPSENIGGMCFCITF